MSSTAASESDCTARLAGFVAHGRDRSRPRAVAAAATRAFANWVGCALGARSDPAVQAVGAMARSVGGRGASSLVGGDRERIDPVNAALVNGTAANALDYDDMHVPTLIHPTGPVVAAALAVAEQEGASGETLLCAIVAGIEVECRIGQAMFPAHYDAGWHITATAGTLGAAAAACSAMALGETQVRHAFGIAATTAGGLRSMLSNSCKSLNIGKAAAAGVSAALLARAGLDSDPGVLESRFGFLDVFAKGADAGCITAGLGDRYLVPEISLKPYPCGVVIHPVIDACIALAVPGDLPPTRVRAVRLQVSPRAAELADRPNPDTALAGRYSLQHAAALALAFGRAGLEAFAVDVADPAVRAWRDRVVLAVDPALGAGEARAGLLLEDGTCVEHAVTEPSGSPGKPLSDAQLEAKFAELAARTIEPAAAHALFDASLHVDRLEDVRVLREYWTAPAVPTPPAKGDRRS